MWDEKVGLFSEIIQIVSNFFIFKFDTKLLGFCDFVKISKYINFLI